MFLLIRYYTVVFQFTEGGELVGPALPVRDPSSLSVLDIELIEFPK